MTEDWELYHNLPALIDFGGKRPVDLICQSLKYPRAQLLLRWSPIAGVRDTGAVVTNPQYRAMTRHRLQGYFKA